ncbi:MAG: AMP-binding protein [Muribaculaceae bacterium]|nr:AMP-binding protein [Muribaculaceae bacterium]
MPLTSINEALAQTFKVNSVHPALSDHEGETLTYSELAQRVVKLHYLFKGSGIVPGDHIAICGRNSSHWAAVAVASITYGAVAVPLLHDFQADTIEHLVKHSDAKLFFVDDVIYHKLNVENLETTVGVLSLTDYGVLLDKDGIIAKSKEDIGKFMSENYPDGFTTSKLSFYKEEPDQLALINYTSGSTGFSKGVMVTYGNIASNERFSVENIPFLHPGDGSVSMLPMAHMFGLIIELFFPLLKGCHIHFLSRVPAPSIILKAFAEVKPKLVIAVPLILEKIIKNKIFPELEKQPLKTLIKIPGVNKIIYKKIKTKLLDAFGGQLVQIIVGGAAFDPTVETFLNKIKFPYTVGYGMTECAPLIAYDVWSTYHKGSVGKVVDRMEFKIDSPDPLTIPGELWVKGANVMKGYYKNSEATEAVFRDGWMNTGDVCQIDKDGYIYIRGRNKSMILGPSGQNIYPEEIEAKLNNLPLVAESIVVDREGKLVALIHPDYEKAKTLKLDDSAIENQMVKNIADLNTQVAPYEKVASMEIMHDEFEKTPKRSIKRFMYK